MKYAVEMGSGVIKYIPSFSKIVSDIQKMIWGDFMDTAYCRKVC
jgi:hypothetical protein